MTDENDAEEHGYGPEDFRKYPIEADIELPPEAWAEACERYHAAEKKGYEANLMDFVQDLIDIEYNWKVLDEDAEAPSNEDVSDAITAVAAGGQWEDAGRSLLAWVHAQVRDDIVTALDQLAWKADNNEPISESDVEHLRDAAEDVEFLAHQAASICPDTEPAPDWKEVLGGEAVREFARRVQEDDGE